MMKKYLTILVTLFVSGCGGQGSLGSDIDKTIQNYCTNFIVTNNSNYQIRTGIRVENLLASHNFPYRYEYLYVTVSEIKNIYTICAKTSLTPEQAIQDFWIWAPITTPEDLVYGPDFKDSDWVKSQTSKPNQTDYYFEVTESDFILAQ
jgi:hypothetical protein